MVGNGTSISVWTTPWLADGDRMRIPLMKNILVDLNLRVSDLMLPNSHLWNMEVLEDLFYPQDIESSLRSSQLYLLRISFAGIIHVLENTLFALVIGWLRNLQIRRLIWQARCSPLLMESKILSGLLTRNQR